MATKVKTKAVKPKIIISNRVYIPASEVDINSIKQHYVTNLYEERACKVCENKPNRHNYQCDGCPAFLERVVLYNRATLKGVPYVGLPTGDKRNMQRKARIDFDDFKIIDRRTDAPFHYPIEFTATLRPAQEQLVEDFMKKKYGMVVAPPRSGKSITMLKICLELGQRTLFLANQHEFLSQIQDHIHGNEKENIPKCTNLPELEEKYGKKLYGYPKIDEDFKTMQFMFMPYQSFISEVQGKARLKKILNEVGTIAVDEVQKSNAKCFASTVTSMRARYKLGCTGTLERKDGKSFIAAAIIGPVSATSTIEALTPTVYVHHTTVEERKYQPGPNVWNLVIDYTAKHDARNTQIVDRVIKDVNNGHSIVIPSLRIYHVLDLQARINEAYGSYICEMFVGGGTKKNLKKREETLSKVKAGEIKVVVGTRQILQLGLNVAQWSCIYEIAPISNEPNLKQETARICTPLEGKRPPIIRLFVDLNVPLSAGCARSTISHMRSFKYKFATSEVQKENLRAVLSSGRKVYDDDTTPVRTQAKSNKSTW